MVSRNNSDLSIQFQKNMKTDVEKFEAPNFKNSATVMESEAVHDK